MCSSCGWGRSFIRGKIRSSAMYSAVKDSLGRLWLSFWDLIVPFGDACFGHLKSQFSHIFFVQKTVIQIEYSNFVYCGWSQHDRVFLPWQYHFVPDNRSLVNFFNNYRSLFFQIKGSEVLTHDRTPVAYASHPTETVRIKTFALITLSRRYHMSVHVFAFYCHGNISFFQKFICDITLIKSMFGKMTFQGVTALDIFVLVLFVKPVKQTFSIVR